MRGGPRKTGPTRTTTMRMMMMTRKGWRSVSTSLCSLHLKQALCQRMWRLLRSRRVGNMEVTRRSCCLATHIGTRLPPPCRLVKAAPMSVQNLQSWSSGQDLLDGTTDIRLCRLGCLESRRRALEEFKSQGSLVGAGRSDAHCRLGAAESFVTRWCLEASWSWDREEGHPPCGVRSLDATVILFSSTILCANRHTSYSSFFRLKRQLEQAQHSTAKRLKISVGSKAPGMLSGFSLHFLCWIC